MRILIVMDPGILVPPKGYGGHERLIAIFATEYLKLGHEVSLLVTEGSYIKGCKIYSFGKEGFPQKKMSVIKAIPFAWKFLYKNRNKFDLIHNFGRLAYLIPVLHHRIKKIMTYGREISSDNIKKIEFLGSKNLIFTACSKNLLSRVKAGGAWRVIYNAIEFNKYVAVEKNDKEAPLIFLGRIEKIKGCHTAIKVAKQTGNRLLIAGNISPLKEEQAYFREQIEPHIDNINVIYLGQVNDEEKNKYLGKAKALLFPIEWDEPFGIVMIEAMACGTPVIAFKRGSVDEVIKENVSGFKVNDMESMIDAIDKLPLISRAACREYAQHKFDAPYIASQYLNIFNKKSKKIVIVTTGQPAANPRVLKEYELLKEKGYEVKVIYTYSAKWSHWIDERKFKNGELKRDDFILAGGSPYQNRVTYIFSRLLFKLFYSSMYLLPFRFIREMAIARATLSLWIQAAKIKGDLYIAHYVGALPGAANAAKKNGGVFAFDAEDYHRGEPVYYSMQQNHIIQLENMYLPQAVFITTASPLITDAYKKLYPKNQVATINNTFSKKYLQKINLNSNGELSLFWFSQNIGPNRGLEIVIEAMNSCNGNMSLHLLGNIRNESYFQSLISKSLFPNNIHILNTVYPDKIFEIASQFDVGLATELPMSENRNICLTNKIFTYMLAGNCIVASDTAAQKQLLNQYPDVGILYNHDNALALASVLQKLIDDRVLLNNYKMQSLKIAKDFLNWENESMKFNSLIEENYSN